MDFAWWDKTKTFQWPKIIERQQEKKRNYFFKFPLKTGSTVHKIASWIDFECEKKTNQFKFSRLCKVFFQNVF